MRLPVRSLRPGVGKLLQWKSHLHKNKNTSRVSANTEKHPPDSAGIAGCNENIYETQQYAKQRRPKPTKKRNCPAYLLIREVVLFPEFSVGTDLRLSTKHVLRREKAEAIHRLKQSMKSNDLMTVHRFYLHVPLPEAHTDHPEDGTCAPLRMIDPFVRNKIDELLAGGLCEVRYIQLIVHDYIAETLLKNEIAGFQTETVVYPTEQEISDYIYLSSTTLQTKKTKMEKYENQQASSLQNETQKSVQELRNILQSCTDDVLTEARRDVKKVIRRVKRCSSVVDGGQLLYRKFPDLDKPKRCKISDKEPLEKNFASVSTTIAQHTEVGNMNTGNILMQPQMLVEPLSGVLAQPPIRSSHAINNDLPSFRKLLQSFSTPLRTMSETATSQPSFVSYIADQ